MNMDGNSLHGNWEKWVSFIDNIRLGTPSNTVLTVKLKIKQKIYYFLPLILGLMECFSL